MSEKKEMVNHPAHYNREGRLEYIEASKTFLTPEEFRGAMKWNIGKYLDRYLDKSSPSEDIKKGRRYFDFLIEYEESLLVKAINTEEPVLTTSEDLNEALREWLDKPNLIHEHEWPMNGSLPSVFPNVYGPIDYGKIKVETNTPIKFFNSNQLLPVEDKNDPEKDELLRKIKVGFPTHCEGIQCTSCKDICFDTKE